MPDEQVEMLNDLVELCRRHVLATGDAIIPEPYLPFIPGRGGSGAWNGILVLAESQNLSDTYGLYRRRLLAASPDERIHRLYWEPQVHIKPWDDGSLKLAVSAAFETNPESFAVSNAVMWSIKTTGGSNKTPDKRLQDSSVDLWKAMLPILAPTQIVTTGAVAGNLMARVKGELSASWEHIRLCSASPMHLNRQTGKLDVGDCLRRHPEIRALLEIHPEYVTKYRKNKIYFAAEAIKAVRPNGAAGSWRS